MSEFEPEPWPGAQWPNPGTCESCGGERQTQGETLGWAIFWNFDGWVCDHCHDILTTED